jgi:hypothetical protein
VEISFYKIVDPKQYKKCRDSHNDIRSHLNTAGLLPVGYCSEACTIRRDADQQVTMISPITAMAGMSFEKKQIFSFPVNVECSSTSF